MTPLRDPRAGLPSGPVVLTPDEAGHILYELLDRVSGWYAEYHAPWPMDPGALRALTARVDALAMLCHAVLSVDDPAEAAARTAQDAMDRQRVARGRGAPAGDNVDVLVDLARPPAKAPASAPVSTE